MVSNYWVECDQLHVCGPGGDMQVVNFDITIINLCIQDYRSTIAGSLKNNSKKT